MKTGILICCCLLVVIGFCDGKIWVKKKPKKDELAVTKEEAKFYDTSATRKHSRKFAPSGLQCCKLGERIGRKQLSCDPKAYHPQAVSGPGNADRTHQMVSDSRAVRLLMKALSKKVDYCATSKYAGNFSKCCRYKESLKRELKACRRHTRRADRKKCRNTVRKMFYSS